MRWLLALMFILLAEPGLAAPDLGTYQDLEGGRVYRDHQKKDIWHPTPAPPVVAAGEDGAPAYSLDIYRYLGRTGTGDQGMFWVRGVLSLSISRERSPEITGRIRKALKVAGVSRPRLRSMPVVGAKVKLLFGNQGQTWKQGARWSGRQLVLSLDPQLAEVLWAAVKAGQTLVSLALEERLSGVRLVDGEWQEAETAAAWTLPIKLDMQAHPTHFRRTEVGGLMSRGYTGLNVFCFDFLEELDPDLYAKIVEVTIPTAGRDLVETATFRLNSDYRIRIEFKLAKDLDQPYRLRVTRILKNGRREVGSWVEKAGESMVDVTDYREPEETDGDEQMDTSTQE